MNDVELYYFAIREIKMWCMEAGIPIPTFSTSLESDPCDVTDPSFIRLNTKAFLASLAEPATLEDAVYYAAHVFGHFLCDFHGKDDTSADLAADFIVRLLDRG